VVFFYYVFGVLVSACVFLKNQEAPNYRSLLMNEMHLQYVLRCKAPLLQSYDVREIARRRRRSIRRHVETGGVLRFLQRVEIERDAAARRFDKAARPAFSRLCPPGSVGPGVANSRTRQAAHASIQPMQRFKKMGRFNSTAQISANYPQIVSLDPGA
jgi:hypothetical protein